MTSFGYFLLVLIIISFWKSYDFCIGLLIIFGPFMVSGVLNIGEKYIQPYLFCELAIVVRTIFEYNIKIRRDGKSILRLLNCFVLYCLLVTLLGPILFSGLMVVGKNLDESYLEGFYPLTFSIDNITQIGYLFLNVFTLICILSNRQLIRIDAIKYYFLISVSISLFLGYWEYVAKIVGGPFPEKFLYAEGRGINTGLIFDRFRMSSLCTEASTFGAFVSSAFWALLQMRRDYKVKVYFLLYLTIIAVILSFSSTAYLAFGFGFILYLYHNNFSSRLLLVSIILGILMFLLLNYLDYYKDIYLMLAEKSDSQSGEVRYNVTLQSIKIFFNSYGFGVGLGSTRSSSFFFDILAQVGIIGAILLFEIFKKLVLTVRNQTSILWIYYYSVVLMFAQIIAEPDFSFSPFWMGLFMAGCCYNRKEVFVK